MRAETYPKMVPLGDGIFALPSINPQDSRLVYLAKNDDPVIPTYIKEALPYLLEVVRVLNRKEKERIRATLVRVMRE